MKFVWTDCYVDCLPVYWAATKKGPWDGNNAEVNSSTLQIQLKTIRQAFLTKNLHVVAVARRGLNGRFDVQRQTLGGLWFKWKTVGKVCSELSRLFFSMLRTNVPNGKRWIKIYTQFWRTVFHNEVQWLIIITWTKFGDQILATGCMLHSKATLAQFNFLIVFASVCSSKSVTCLD